MKVKSLSKKELKLFQGIIDLFKEQKRDDVLEMEVKEDHKKNDEVSMPTIKANFFLKNSGMFSLGGDAVEESRNYDE